jgi:hypothetical protein
LKSRLTLLVMMAGAMVVGSSVRSSPLQELARADSTATGGSPSHPRPFDGADLGGVRLGTTASEAEQALKTHKPKLTLSTGGFSYTEFSVIAPRVPATLGGTSTNSAAPSYAMVVRLSVEHKQRVTAVTRTIKFDQKSAPSIANALNTPIEKFGCGSAAFMFQEDGFGVAGCAFNEEGAPIREPALAKTCAERLQLLPTSSANAVNPNGCGRGLYAVFRNNPQHGEPALVVTIGDYAEHIGAIKRAHEEQQEHQRKMDQKERDRASTVRPEL